MYSARLKVTFSFSVALFEIISYGLENLSPIFTHLRRFKLFRPLNFRSVIMINKTMPIMINTEPLIDQEGLLYINEVVGPINDLDCEVKIKPNKIITAPITVTHVFNNLKMLLVADVYVL